MPRTIEIEDGITVGALAESLSIPVTNLITELMKNGVMATVNERIDFDTAQIVVSGMDLDVELSKKTVETTNPKLGKKERSVGSETRPPVVAVMGHVDHGKTSLLDAICGSSVASGEAGGITQHISAYQIEHQHRKITFLDTPGHSAFAAIREHGAHLTDVVVIVVAADDGVMPQTVEAIRFAKQAGVKIVVAINKIDKSGADTNRIKQQLAESGVMIEGWGGDVTAVEVSAKTGLGVEQLLDMVLLVADIEELKSDSQGPAQGLIIEAHQEQGRGPVGVALIESGTLRKGDFLVAGSTYAKVRNLETTSGQKIDTAGPSTPALVTGFKALPEFGDDFQVFVSEKAARNRAAEVEAARSKKGQSADMSEHELIRIIDREKQVSSFNVIIKADVQGSLTSVADSLKSLDIAEVVVRVVGSGVGVITEKDVHLAATSSSVIYGFNVEAPANIKRLASRDKVSIRLFSVIYELIDDAKKEMSELLAPEIVKNDVGRLIVRAVFKTTKTEVICGGEVTKGKLIAPALATVFRGDEILADQIQVVGLKRGPQEVKEVQEGEMCGVNLKTETRLDLAEGDRLELYTQEVVERSL